jgi:tetratricopeptide (TPR) repeat protein
VPKDWHLLGEIAEYVGPTVRDFEAGCAIAQRALDLNPWTSSWLWNVLGDCYYYQGRYADAHQAFSCAQRLDPNDVRTNLNLGHSFASFARYPEALVALAHGLSHDSGAYRSLLLQQQEQVLAALAQRHTALQEGLVRRAERFGAA